METGIKELKEVIEAIESLALDAIAALKDGIGFDDITVFTNNFDKIKVAYEGFSDIPAEIKDLDKNEITELIASRIAFVYKVLEELKKEA